MARLDMLGNERLAAVAEELLSEMFGGSTLKSTVVADGDVEKLKALIKALVEALADAILRAKKEWRSANDKGLDDAADTLKDLIHELTLLIIVLNRHLIEFIDSQEEVKKAAEKMKDIVQEAHEVKTSTAQTTKFLKEFKGLIDSVFGLIKLVK